MRYQYREIPRGDWHNVNCSSESMRERMFQSLRAQMNEGRSLAQTHFVYRPAR